ncbi:MAG: M24 family metallopeptidase, partial [Candidatus Nanoarchaeia archaeon]
MEIHPDWKKAGRIAGEARLFGIGLIKEGVTFLEVADKIEEFIAKKDAKPGFPVQISINGLAAHYTPFPEDTSIFKKG